MGSLVMRAATACCLGGEDTTGEKVVGVGRRQTLCRAKARRYMWANPSFQPLAMEPMKAPEVR